jgi:hypothetical protein
MMEKLASDVEFYRILLRRFVLRKELQQFMEEHHFQDHFVLGVHLRLGNGERQHFLQAKRGVGNEFVFVSNLIELLRQFLLSIQASHPERFAVTSPTNCLLPNKKRPLIFLATDSAKHIPFIMDAARLIGVETVVLPQVRSEKDGATFAT